jgi:hypothetical protein
VPPFTVKFTDPVLFPKHPTLTWVVVKLNAFAGWVIVIDTGAETQPLVLVAVYVYVPGDKFIVGEPPYVYGAFPPDAVSVTEPVPPKHKTLLGVTVKTG